MSAAAATRFRQCDMVPWHCLVANRLVCFLVAVGDLHSVCNIFYS